MVPDNREVKTVIFREYNDASYAAHLSVRKTVKSVQLLTLPNTWAEFETCVKYFPRCQVNKGNNTKPHGLMQPDEVPPYPWHTVTTDYINSFPKTAAKHNAIAVFVDALTRYWYHVAKKALVQTQLTCPWIVCMSTLGYLCIYCLTEGHNPLACSTSLWQRHWAIPGN